MPPNIIPKNIHPLTSFKRNTNDFIEEMKSSGDPMVLTVNGKASLVVQDADAYQKLLDATETAETIAGIRRGLQDIDAGRVQPLQQAFAEIRKKHKIPRPASKS